MDYEGFKREILKMSDIDLSLYKEKQMKRRDRFTHQKKWLCQI